jgi:hypothetical protein
MIKFECHAVLLDLCDIGVDNGGDDNSITVVPEVILAEDEV